MRRQVDILVADDHPVVREGLTRIIEQEPRLHIVAQSGNGRETLALLREHGPDIAVLDIAMPGMTGLEIARTLRGDPVIVVILTMYKDKEYFDEAMELGVRGYLLKESAARDLLACINAVLMGDHYISPAISGYLVRNTAVQKSRSAGCSPIDSLTSGEKRVLKLIAQGKTSRKVAEELFISYRTVQNHRANICRKLGLKGHNKLLQFAIGHRHLL